MGKSLLEVIYYSFCYQIQVFSSISNEWKFDFSIDRRTRRTKFASSIIANQQWGNPVDFCCVRTNKNNLISRRCLVIAFTAFIRRWCLRSVSASQNAIETKLLLCCVLETISTGFLCLSLLTLATFFFHIFFSTCSYDRPIINYYRRWFENSPIFNCIFSLFFRFYVLAHRTRLWFGFNVGMRQRWMHRNYRTLQWHYRLQWWQRRNCARLHFISMSGNQISLCVRRLRWKISRMQWHARLRRQFGRIIASLFD